MERGKPKKPMTAGRALDRLEGLCSRAERCSYEAMQKMRGWGLSEADARKVLEQLVATRYIDDRRFARAFVNDKVRFERRGRMYISKMLYAKRMPREIIEEAMERIDEKEYRENLRYTLLAKARTLGEEALKDFDFRTKIYRYGVARGYEPGLVASELRALIKAQE